MGVFGFRQKRSTSLLFNLIWLLAFSMLSAWIMNDALYRKSEENKRLYAYKKSVERIRLQVSVQWSERDQPPPESTAVSAATSAGHHQAGIGQPAGRICNPAISRSIRQRSIFSG